MIEEMFDEIIRHYPDFPKPGIDFIDVLPFLQNKEAFRGAIEAIDRLGTAPNVTAVEARGFLFSTPLLAVSYRVEALLPVRKKGKTPHLGDGDLRRVAVQKEYGFDELFYRRSDIDALSAPGEVCGITLFDDFLATGGTALELAKALEQENCRGKRLKVTEFIFLAELPALGGRRLLESIAPVHTLMSIDGVE